MRNPAVAVRATDLILGYGERIAVRAETLELPAGAVTAVIGPNGSGKTTLLRGMSGLESPRRGTLEVLGARAGTQDGSVAHVMQSTRVNEAVPLTVVEIVRMGRYARVGLFGRFRPDDHAAVDRALERMEIGDLASRHLLELSGGQRQRVFVAQGLAQEAEVLLLDEPNTGLDLPSQDRINAALADEVEAGRTVIVTTHEVAAAAAADHVVLLATHVVASGPPREVLTDEHLSHAYGRTAYRTEEGTLVIGDPHIHGARLRGHEHHG